MSRLHRSDRGPLIQKISYQPRVEKIDPPKQLESGIAHLARLIRSSKRIVVLTGAGISTECGLKDYRSGVDTILATGMGQWTALQQKAVIDALGTETTQISCLDSQIKTRRQRLTESSQTNDDTTVTDRSNSKKRKFDSSTLRSTSPATPPPATVIDIAEEYSPQFEEACLSAIPSFTHMALAELHKRGKLYGIGTQNVDGLHRLSGLPTIDCHSISTASFLELHGASDVLMCVACDQFYYFDHHIFSPAHHRHWSVEQMYRHRKKHLAQYFTRIPKPNFIPQDYDKKYSGHFCSKPKCREPLADIEIEFGDAMFDDITGRWKELCDGADLAIALGTSLCVDPARQLVINLTNKKLAIVNLQETDSDHDINNCVGGDGVAIHAKVDEVFKRLMKQLNIPVPPFTLKRFIKVEQVSGQQVDECYIHVTGVTSSADDAYTICLFKKVEFELIAQHKSPRHHYSTRSPAKETEPTIQLVNISPSSSTSPTAIDPVTGRWSQLIKMNESASSGSTSHAIRIHIQFFGHRGEPDIELDVTLKSNTQQIFEVVGYVTKQKKIVWQPIGSPTVTTFNPINSLSV